MIGMYNYYNQSLSEVFLNLYRVGKIDDAVATVGDCSICCSLTCKLFCEVVALNAAGRDISCLDVCVEKDFEDKRGNL